MYVAGNPLTFPQGTTVRIQIGLIFAFTTSRIQNFWTWFQLRDSVTVKDKETNNDKEIDVAVTLVNANLNINSLLEYMRNGFTVDCPQHVVQATDIAMRGCLSDNL